MGSIVINFEIETSPLHNLNRFEISVSARDRTNIVLYKARIFTGTFQALSILRVV